MRHSLNPIKYLLLAALVCLGGCATNIRNADDSCEIFEDKTLWYRYAKQSEVQWGVPVSIQLAVIYQESSFKAKSLPKRKYVLGFIPWGRVSSAKGYSQALDAVWQEYVDERGGLLTSRKRFKDSVDFVGWYFARFAPKAGIRLDDAFSLYILYHEGPGGYRKGRWKNNQPLLAVAKKVKKRAELYQKQLKSCERYFNMVSLYFI